MLTKIISAIYLSMIVPAFPIEQAPVQAAYRIENALPKNYVTNGSVDYTEYIQKAITEHSSVIFPGFPLLVNDNGLNIPSNRRLEFSSGSKLILKPTDKSRYYILQLRGVQNVTIVNPVIVGDRYEHLAKDGQWGYGIGIFSSQDITIESPQISNCWGDGIGIAKDPVIGSPSKDVSIQNARISNCRRNGISVISVDGLKLTNPDIRNIEGNSPQSGIDIEPDSPKDVLKRINIESPSTQNNKGDGILIYLVNFYGNNDQQVDITINKHKDIGSSNGARIISYKKPEANLKGKITGNINYSAPSWSDNVIRPFDARNLSESSINFNISAPTIKKNGRLYKKTESIRTIRSALNAQSKFKIF